MKEKIFIIEAKKENNPVYQTTLIYKTLEAAEKSLDSLCKKENPEFVTIIEPHHVIINMGGWGRFEYKIKEYSIEDSDYEG